MNKPMHPAAASAQAFQVANLRPTERLFEDEEGRDRLEKAVSRYPDRRAALLPMLGYAQERNGWVSDENMAEIAEALALTPAFVRSVATFYTMYNKHPVGRHLIQVCTCISCHLHEAEEVFEKFMAETGTRAGEVSEDGRFTLLAMECLGACEGAPCALVNGDRHDNLSIDTIDRLIDSLPE